MKKRNNMKSKNQKILIPNHFPNIQQSSIPHTNQENTFSNFSQSYPENDDINNILLTESDNEIVMENDNVFDENIENDNILPNDNYQNIQNAAAENLQVHIPLNVIPDDDIDMIGSNQNIFNDDSSWDSHRSATEEVNVGDNTSSNVNFISNDGLFSTDIKQIQNYPQRRMYYLQKRKPHYTIDMIRSKLRDEKKTNKNNLESKFAINKTMREDYIPPTISNDVISTILNSDEPSTSSFGKRKEKKPSFEILPKITTVKRRENFPATELTIKTKKENSPIVEKHVIGKNIIKRAYNLSPNQGNVVPTNKKKINDIDVKNQTKNITSFKTIPQKTTEDIVMKDVENKNTELKINPTVREKVHKKAKVIIIEKPVKQPSQNSPLVDEILQSNRNDPFDVFKFSKTAKITYSGLKRKFNALSKKLHPDKESSPGAHEAFIIMRQAYIQLKKITQIEENYEREKNETNNRKNAKPQKGYGIKKWKKL